MKIKYLLDHEQHIHPIDWHGMDFQLVYFGKMSVVVAVVVVAAVVVVGKLVAAVVVIGNLVIAVAVAIVGIVVVV